ncbi:MAG TPA: OpgC domain-containing protein [Solimonas sp.]
MNRRAELDALRGLLLVLMTITHLPTRFSAYSSQAFGFVSAAEGFVFLSGFVAGLLYWRGMAMHGETWMRAKLFARARELYGWHLALLVFLFTIGAALGHYAERPLLRNLLSFYFEQPGLALWTAPLLLYQPPLLDILPTYIVMLLLTPVWLGQARRHGWAPVLFCSALIWVFAQVGGRALLLDGFNLLTGDRVPTLPLPALGYFDDFAWQLLWVFGLWSGHLMSEHRLPAQLPRRSMRVAAVLTALAYLAWYHGVLEAALMNVGIPLLAPGDVPLFDKVVLRPLRVLNFAVLAITIGLLLPRLSMLLRNAAMALLGLLGRASLRVFGTHLFLALMAFALVDRDESPLDAVTEATMLVAVFGTMLAVAWHYHHRQRQHGT